MPRDAGRQWAWGVVYHRPTERHYVTERGQVIRFSKQEAEACCVEMRAFIDQAAKRKDPLCVLEQGQGYAFAPYSVLVAVSGSGGQDVHRVESVEPQRVTRAILDAHNEADNWYAPLFLLRDEEEGTIITLPGAVVLLSNPLQLSAKLENWRHAGHKLPSIATTILDTDEAVDRLFSQVFDDGLGLVLDPILDGNGELVAGYVFYDQRRVAAPTAV